MSRELAAQGTRIIFLLGSAFEGFSILGSCGLTPILISWASIDAVLRLIWALSMRNGSLG